MEKEKKEGKKRKKGEKVAGAVDAMRDGKSIFNIFLPQLRHGAPVCKPNKVSILRLIQSRSITHETPALAELLRQRKKEINKRLSTDISFNLQSHPIYIYFRGLGWWGREKLILLRND